MEIVPFPIFLLLFSFTSYAQEPIEFYGEGLLTGILSSEEIIPFWFYKNGSTRIGESTNGAIYGKSWAKFKWEIITLFSYIQK